MSVHYKFKNTLDFDTITFDGLHISVGDLKRDLKRKLGKLTDFDLQITNAQTKEEYTDDNNLIPKNTSLIIARVPLVHLPKKFWDVLETPAEPRTVAIPDNLGLDISKMDGSEEDKIQAMMLQSTAEYDPKSYQKLRSQPQTGEVPASYRCNRCKKTGHWIKNCPFNNHKDFMDIKKNTGIPRSFQNRDEKQEEAEKADLPKPAADTKQEIPDDLICSICRDLFTDAVMIPCCGSSFCDDCVRTALLESDDNECPDCKEKGSSPASLIPNRFLRNSVNSFKSATGYTASQANKVVRKQPVEAEKETEETPPVDDTKEKEEPVKEKPVEIEPKIDESEKKTEAVDETAKPKDATENKEEAENKEETVAHDDFESDYEDNITVKMPPAQTESNRTLYREKPYNGRNSRPLQPPGIENSPQNQFQAQHSGSRRSPSASAKRKDWEREREARETGPERSSYEMPLRVSHHANAEPGPHPNYSREMQESHRQANPHEMFPMQRMGGVYPHMPAAHMPMNPVPPMPSHHMPPFDNSYGHMDPRANMGFPPFIRQPFPVAVRPGMPPMRRPPGDIRPGIPSNPNLASVYQGVAAKVGTGIIDDPLEVFNRIMKEKEKRKEERRRSPDIRRSRSPDRQQRGRYRPSPADRRPIREPFPRENRGHSREKRERNEREREKIKEREKPFMRRRRSTSFSDRSSRSRTWSMSPPRRRSRSPLHQRRSRSRPQNMSDRLRAEKNRMSRKGDGFHSVGPVQNRRSRSHGRYHQHALMRKHTSTEEYNEKNFKRVARSPSPQFRREEGRMKIESNARRGIENKNETLEPPPPGFESGHYYNWEQGEDKGFPSNMPPDAYDNFMPENVSERKMYDQRRERSQSKSSSKSHNKKLRDNRSNSPSAKPSHRKQKEDSTMNYGRSRDEHNRARDDHRSRDEHSRARDEHNRPREEHSRAREEPSRAREDHSRAREDHSRTREEHSRTREEHSRVRDDNIRARDEHSSARHRDEKSDRRERNHKEISQNPNEKGLTIHALKENAKKIEMMERNYAHAGSSEKSKKDSSFSPSSDKNRSIKSGSRSEKRMKERKKKAKKEKTERKKLKKDKKEKRERSKQTSATEPEAENEEQYEQTEKISSANIIPQTFEKENCDADQLQQSAQSIVDLKAAEKEQHTKNSPSDILPNETKFLSQDDEAQLDETEKEIGLLYDDVCEKIDNSFQQDKPTTSKDRAGKTPPPEFNRFDSVLDIHGYDTDFDDSHTNAKNIKATANPIPISKWELDEPNGTGQSLTDSILQDELEVDTKVTNEVLRKAEKAIFARAINAIRPIEAKKHSSEKIIIRSSKERTPPIISSRKREDPVNNLKDFQITVPVGNTQERSVEFKSDKSERIHSPSQSKPSIRDRLGSKVSVQKSRISPQRHSGFHIDEKTRRDHSKDRTSRLDLGHTDRHFNRDKSIDASSNKKVASKDDRSGVQKRQRSRERKHTKEYERDHYKERERDKSHNFHKSDARTKVDEHTQNKRSKSEHDHAPGRHDGNQSRHTKKPQYSENERDEHRPNDRKQQHHDAKYIDNDAFNFERSRVAVNPFRKNLDPSDLMLADSFERDNSKLDLSKEQSSSSSGSDSDTDSDDAKRKKKRKEKKEKKRARRSSSIDSSSSVKKKHKKKRSKSSKKKKKSKK